MRPIRSHVRSGAAAMMVCAAPILAAAQSSASYSVAVQEGAATGSSSSASYRVQDLVGTTFASGPAYSASYAVKTGVHPEARFDRPAVSLSATPVQAIVGQPLVLRALVASGAAVAGSVSLTDNGAALAGCEAVAVQPLDGSISGAGVATCAVNAASDGSHHYVAQFGQLPEGGARQAALDVSSTAVVPLDYTDLWWGGTSQNGWGISIAQHGGVQFNVLYTYDAEGKPLWYVMPGGTWDAAHTTFSGSLYVPTSAPFDAYVASRVQVGTPVGKATIRFTGSGTAQLNYSVGGVSGSKAIERQPFALDDAAPRLQVNDMWWGGEMQDGWGVNVAQQGRMLFVTWFSYDANGRDTWFVVPGGAWTGAAFTGNLYATTSSSWLGTEYSPAAFAPVKVGSMTLDFSDQGWATMTYTVNGLTQSKTIVRQPY